MSRKRERKYRPRVPGAVLKQPEEKLQSLYRECIEELDDADHQPEKIPNLWAYEGNTDFRATYILNAGCILLSEDEEASFVVYHELGHALYFERRYRWHGMRDVPAQIRRFAFNPRPIEAFVEEGFANWYAGKLLDTDHPGNYQLPNNLQQNSWELFYEHETVHGTDATYEMALGQPPTRNDLEHVAVAIGRDDIAAFIDDL